MTDVDKEYILTNYKFLTPKEIAFHLQRNPKTINAFLKEKGLLGEARRVANVAGVEHDLRKTEHWEQLKKQFMPDELESFVYHWNNTIRQFRDDVTHLEELQIIDLIKIELLMNRYLVTEMQSKTRINELELKILDEESVSIDNRDLQKIEIYQATLAQLQSSRDTASKEYMSMAARKEKMFQALKSTREQRIQEVENSKDTMAGWIKMLIKHPELRRKLGIDAERMRIATNVEYTRLSDYHTYNDGEVDQPILTSETIKDDHYGKQ